MRQELSLLAASYLPFSDVCTSHSILQGHLMCWDDSWARLIKREAEERARELLLTRYAQYHLPLTKARHLKLHFPKQDG